MCLNNISLAFYKKTSIKGAFFKYITEILHYQGYTNWKKYGSLQRFLVTSKKSKGFLPLLPLPQFFFLFFNLIMDFQKRTNVFHERIEKELL